MKIILAARRPAYPLFIGGSDISFHEIAKGMAACGNNVIVAGEYAASMLADAARRNTVSSHNNVSAQPSMQLHTMLPPLRERFELAVQSGYTVQQTLHTDFEKMFERLLAEEKPNVLCTHLEGSREVIYHAHTHRIPVAHFVRDCSNPLNLLPLRTLATLPSVTIANSNHTAEHVRRQTGICPLVVHPIIPTAVPGDITDDSTLRRSVVFVNPCPHKGEQVIFRVASQYPDISILVIPGWGRPVDNRWSALPNVEAWHWPVQDMTRAYKSARIAVMPSQGSEGFGRVAVEAQSHGLPVVASRHSGLAEILHDSAVLIDNFHDPEAWATAIRHVLANSDLYQELRERGLRNAQKFSPAAILPDLNQILTSLHHRTPLRPGI